MVKHRLKNRQERHQEALINFFKDMKAPLKNLLDINIEIPKSTEVTHKEPIKKT